MNAPALALALAGSLYAQSPAPRPAPGEENPALALCRATTEWDQFNKYSGCILWERPLWRGSLNLGMFEYTRNRQDYLYQKLSPALKQPFRYDRGPVGLRETSSIVFRLQWTSKR